MTDTLWSGNTFATNTEDESRFKDNITNPYVDFLNTASEQDVVRLQTAESIMKNGDEFVYIRRTLVDVDNILGEDTQNSFSNGYKFVAYIENFEQYNGGQDSYSEWGGGIDDRLDLTVEPELFKHQVDNNMPLSGDLIYWPKGKALFEITWNEDEQPFYTNGSLTQWKIEAHKFIYNGEVVDVTNQGTIDTTDTQPFTDINTLDGKIDNFNPEEVESDQVQTEGNILKSDIDETNPFGIDI